MTSLQIAFALFLFSGIVLMPLALERLVKQGRITPTQVIFAAVPVLLLTQLFRYVL